MTHFEYHYAAFKSRQYDIVAHQFSDELSSMARSVHPPQRLGFSRLGGSKRVDDNYDTTHVACLHLFKLPCIGLTPWPLLDVTPLASCHRLETLGVGVTELSPCTVVNMLRPLSRLLELRIKGGIMRDILLAMPCLRSLICVDVDWDSTSFSDDSAATTKSAAHYITPHTGLDLLEISGGGRVTTRLSSLVPNIQSLRLHGTKLAYNQLFSFRRL